MGWWTDIKKAGSSLSDHTNPFDKDFQRKVGNLWDDVTGVTAAEGAAESERQGLSEARIESARQFDAALETQKPWLEAGGRALSSLEAGIGGGRFDTEQGQYQTPEFQDMQFDFEADPGYKFRLQQGQDIVESSAASRGGLFSGGTGTALQEFGQGLASQEYGQAYNRFADERNVNRRNYESDRGFGYGQFMDDYNRERAGKTDQYNRLANLAGVGQMTAGNVASQQITQGGNLANLALQGGNIGAQRSMAGYQGGMNLLNTGLQIGSAAAATFSDIRLKENIDFIRIENGHNIYSFNYIGQSQRYTGVMAQEVLKKSPESVVEIDGYLAVKYGEIGVTMEAI